MLMFNADELFERLGLTVRCEDCMHRNDSCGDVRCENNTWSEVCDVLDHMKLIDAVPVVRCKDCFLYGECKAAEWYGENGNGYCSVGDRRRGDDVTG